ncbi:ABC transporter substrate-binding protein [Demequina activiva]|uniref:Amino acid ABC transporter substrate-binding protein n=1 Tax=Demequina activiva TaxID=1582364 RepID=A0A919Q250_9MICO|nr:ABC transporter substrate-binding protein [Demequina activiva]GIG54481.1 amino acid ABC transporter substrate-binding protein [Demequina activiva]
MARWNTIARGAALAAAASLALAACSSEDGGSEDTGSEGTGSGDALKIGSLLPLTGSLAFLGPPEVAGVDLAAKEINDAGGIFGADVEIIHEDSSDTDNPQIAQQSVSSLISDEVAAIVGAASSSVSLNVVDDIAAASIVQISPANTSTALSGYSPFYFRTAPPDTVQGDALANLMLGDGIENLGILLFADDYATSLRDVVSGVYEENGATITYGNSGDEFQTDAANFESIVQDVLATNPDGILVIAFDQTKAIIPALVGAGFPSDKLYLTDGNTADYSADFEPGTMTGAQGTIPGANASDEFKTLLDEVHGEPLDSYAYGAESYDATMLVALAALKGGGSDGQTVADNLAAVSGADGGTECTGWVECSELIESGEDIIYQAVSGVGPFNEDNDPSSAYVGVYEYGDDNIQTWVEAVFGEV